MQGKIQFIKFKKLQPIRHPKRQSSAMLITIEHRYLYALMINNLTIGDG